MSDLVGRMFCVMPPTDPVEPPTGDITPYPDEILTLGCNRWLSLDGTVLTTELGVPVDVRPNTATFWEATAVRGTGRPLAELMDAPPT